MCCLYRSLGPAFGAAVTLVSGSPACGDVVELQAAADNTLYEDPAGALSNGAGQYLFAGTNSGSVIKRGLIRFDVASALPPDASITNVSLVLHLSRSAGGDQPVALHRVLSDWGEGDTDADGAEGGGGPATPGSATWLHTFYDQAFWDTPGGDFDAAPSAERIIGAAEGYYEWSSPGLALDVQAWLNGDAVDFGWIMICGELDASTAKRFDSRENPDTLLRPTLVVEYIPAPGGLLITSVIGGIVAAGRPQRRYAK